MRKDRETIPERLGEPLQAEPRQPPDGQLDRQGDTIQPAAKFGDVRRI